MKNKSAKANILNKSSSTKIHIILTGGGSGGHLLPARTIALFLKESGYCVHYVGREDNLERHILKDDAVDSFYVIPTGKLRRNLTPKTVFLNLIDLFKVSTGIFVSLKTIRKIKAIARSQKKGSELQPVLALLSTGGYVSLPVVFAAWILRIPIAVHEQTAAGGLANRIAARFAKWIFISVPESAQYYPSQKVLLTGYPIRRELKPITSVKKYTQTTESGQLQKFLQNKKPLILFSGGSNGSLLINMLIKKHLSVLTQKYQIIHQTGKNFLADFSNHQNKQYFPFDFISGNDWNDILICSDILVGRSGAGIVHECVHLKKRAIFIPLAIAQQNEQLRNAEYAQKSIKAIILNETKVNALSSADFINIIDTLLKHKPKKPTTNNTKNTKPLAITSNACAKIVDGLANLTIKT